MIKKQELNKMSFPRKRESIKSIYIDPRVKPEDDKTGKFHTILDLVLIFLASLTPLLWFSGNKILAGHDSGFPLNPLVHFLDRLFLWTNRFGFGKDQTMEAGGFFIHGQEALLQALGFSLQDTQKIIFVSWFFLLGLAMYIFSRVLFDQRKYRFLGVMAALFYMFNTYTIQSWPVIERTKFSMMIALPLALSILMGFFRGRLSIFKTAGLLGLVFFFFNAGGTNGLPHFGALVILILPAFLFLIFTAGKEQKKIITLGVVFFIIWFFLNSYWLLPFLYYTHNSLAQAIGERGGVLGTSAWLDVVSQSTSISRLLRWQGEPGWYPKDSTHPFGSIYLQNPLLILLSFLWPVLAYLSPVLAKKEERKNIFLLLLIALTAMFFSSGSHFPTGIAFNFLFEHIPGFIIFRSSWFKFNYGISLAYAILIAYTISRIYLWLKDKRQKILSFLLLGGFGIILVFYNFPYFAKQMFVWNKPLTLMVNVPKYIYDFGKWTETLPSATRFLVLPPLDKQWSGLAYSWGYFSSTTPHAVLTNRTMYSNYESLAANEKKLLLVVYDDLLYGREQEARKILSLLQVDYLLLEKDALSDLGWYKTVPATEFSQSLAKISWIVPDKTFSQWQVYKVENKKPIEPINLSNNAVITNLPIDDLIVFLNFSSCHSREGGNLYDNYLMDPRVKPEDDKVCNDSNQLYLNTEKPEELSLKNFVWKTECLNCAMEKINFSLPEVKILPGSRFYNFFVSDKEKKLLENENNLDFSQKIDLYLGLSLKRLAEIDRLTELGRYEKTSRPVAELKDYLNNLKNLLETTNESEIKLVFSQKRLYNFSQFAREKLGFFERRGIDNQLKIEFKDILRELADLDNLVWENKIWKETTRKIYLSDIPMSGEYKIEFLDKDLNNVQLSLDSRQIDHGQLVNISKGQHVVEAKFLSALPQKPAIVIVSLQDIQPTMLPEIKIKRIDQTKYLLNIEKPQNDFFLYFNDTFHPDWKVYADDKPIPEERHFQANGFGNGWIIKKEDFRREGLHTIGLAYLPQSFFQLGMVVSGVSFIAIVLSLIVSILL